MSLAYGQGCGGISLSLIDVGGPISLPSLSQWAWVIEEK